MTQDTTNTNPPAGHPSQDALDVAAVLAHLREEVRARRMAAAAEPDAAHSAIERQLQRCSEQLEITRVVSAHWPLESRSLPQRAHNFINKVVRRLLRWYINPIVEQQNAFNDTTARTLRLLAEGYSELLHQQAAADDERHPPPAARPAAEPAPPASSAAVPPDTQALQAVVDEQARREPPAHFPEIALPPLAAQLAQRQQVSAHWPLPEATPAQKLVALVHKLMRFSLRWLINPIVEQQNSFNAAVVESIEPLRQADAEARTLQAARRAQRARPTS